PDHADRLHPGRDLLLRDGVGEALGDPFDTVPARVHVLALDLEGAERELAVRAEGPYRLRRQEVRRVAAVVDRRSDLVAEGRAPEDPQGPGLVLLHVDVRGATLRLDLNLGFQLAAGARHGLQARVERDAVHDVDLVAEFAPGAAVDVP